MPFPFLVRVISLMGSARLAPWTGTVLLHLLHTLLPPPRPTPSTLPNGYSSPPTSSTNSPKDFRPPINSIYITQPAPFPSVEEFVDDAAQSYGLDLVRIEGSMKAALEEYLEPGKKGEGVEGVLVGTRRNDPHGGASFSPLGSA